MAQKRRRDQLAKRRQRQMTLLCVLGGVGAVLLSLVTCLLIFDPFWETETAAAPVATPLPYDADAPFSINDLTGSQIRQTREKGRMHVSDGPRGISVGDSLEKLLERYPSTSTSAQYDKDLANIQSDEELIRYSENRGSTSTNRQYSGELTGMQADEEIILYCASYYENANGRKTALPPRGLINNDAGEITVTLLAPTSAYPAGTMDNYGSYEHVYCLYNIDPETMTISSIILGIDQ